jgi:hypoxanthine phosphoribosyltransferase
MKFEYVGWPQFAALCGTLYRRVAASSYRPDLIIAIARGGYPVGRVLADYLGIMDLVSIKIEHYHGPDKMPEAVVRYPLPASVDGRRVLLVDDVSDSGDSFAAALGHITAKGRPAGLRTAVLHYKETSGIAPDYYAERVTEWRWITYPWAVVEDLSRLVGRLPRQPKDVDELGRLLKTELAIELPPAVFDEVAPVVLERAAEAEG